MDADYLNQYNVTAGQLSKLPPLWRTLVSEYIQAILNVLLTLDATAVNMRDIAETIVEPLPRSFMTLNEARRMYPDPEDFDNEDEDDDMEGGRKKCKTRRVSGKKVSLRKRSKKTIKRKSSKRRSKH